MEGNRVYSTTAHVSQLKQWRLVQKEADSFTEKEDPERETAQEDSFPEPDDTKMK